MRNVVTVKKSGAVRSPSRRRVERASFALRGRDSNTALQLPQAFHQWLHDMSKQRQKQLMVLPAMIGLFVFAYLPMYGIIVAFKDYRAMDGIWGSAWVGLHHFRVFFSSSFVRIVIGNTLKVSITDILFVFPAPIILALLLNELKALKYKRVVQTISYLPHFVSWVIVAGMVYSMLSVDGVVNNLLRLAGILDRSRVFLAEGRNFIPLIILTSIWKGVGWESIIYLAALSGVNLELYEAATIDGANRLQKALHISIPAIMPVIVILLIFSISRLMNTNFDQVYLLQNSAIIEAAETIDTYVFKVGIGQARFDYGAAVGLFKAAIGFILLVAANWVSKKVTSYGLW